jgi:hypothetical protein
MWTLIVTTLVFAGSVAGGVAVNTAFLDFADEAKCRKAAAATEASERGRRQGWAPEHFPAGLLPDHGAVCGALRLGLAKSSSWRPMGNAAMTFIQCEVELRRTDGKVLSTSTSLQMRPVVDQLINVPVDEAHG